jgi:hypothetical protein
MTSHFPSRVAPMTLGLRLVAVSWNSRDYYARNSNIACSFRHQREKYGVQRASRIRLTYPKASP